LFFYSLSLSLSLSLSGVSLELIGVQQEFLVVVALKSVLKTLCRKQEGWKWIWSIGARL
jgi:hypothetical protein